MANKLIPSELDELIQEYLTDGVLTDKERQVILKKAVGMGLDRDEIDLYLDAQVQKIDQATDAVMRRHKSKACPYCGAPVPQLTDKCPECGQFITPEASKDLQDILDNLEEALVDFKSGQNLDRSKASIERYSRKAKLYFSNNPKIKPLLEEIQEELKMSEKQIKSEERKDFVFSILKNKWFWPALPLFIGILLMLSSDYNMRDTGIILSVLGVLGFMFVGGLFKNKWFWISLPIIFGLLLLLTAWMSKDEDFGLFGGCFLMFGLICLGLAAAPKN